MSTGIIEGHPYLLRDVVWSRWVFSLDNGDIWEMFVDGFWEVIV